MIDVKQTEEQIAKFAADIKAGEPLSAILRDAIMFGRAQVWKHVDSKRYESAPPEIDCFGRRIE